MANEALNSQYDGDSFATEGGDCGPIDCNDSSAAVYPGANEICGDQIDQNCDGVEICWAS